MIGLGLPEIFVLVVMAAVALVVWLSFAKRYTNAVRGDLREEVEQLRRQVVRQQDEIEKLRDENERLRGQTPGTSPQTDTGIKPSDT
jgi:hypothetical protein